MHFSSPGGYGYLDGDSASHIITNNVFSSFNFQEMLNDNYTLLKIYEHYANIMQVSFNE